MRIERRLRLARALDAYELEVWAIVHQVTGELAHLLRRVPSLGSFFGGVHQLAAHAVEARRLEILRWNRLLARPDELAAREARGWFDRLDAFSPG